MVTIQRNAVPIVRERFKFKLLWYFAAFTAWQVAASKAVVMKVALTFHTCGSRLPKLFVAKSSSLKFQVQNLFQNSGPSWPGLDIFWVHYLLWNLFFSSRTLSEYRIMFLAMSANVNSLFRIENVIFMPRCPILECFRNHHILNRRFLSKLEF